jgi:hypothetical protein
MIRGIVVTKASDAPLIQRCDLTQYLAEDRKALDRNSL